VRIVEHEQPRIIEVVYPTAALTALGHADYTIRIKQAMEKQPGPWALLVDQRAVRRLDDKLKDKMLALYAFAAKRGMVASARIVKSPAEALRLTEMVRDGELKGRVRMFTERAEAWDWLREALRAAPPSRR
jgi:hypothetical protein